MISTTTTQDSKSDEISRDVWRIAFVIVFGAFMAGLDTSLVNVGLNTITRSLHGSLETAQWVASSYLIALAAALPACSWLGKRLGASRLWLLALGAFTISSTACAAAPTISVLVLCRVFQGIAGGMLVPSGQTVLGRAAGPRHMGTVMNTAGIAVVLAPAIGPTVGGLLISALSWRWLFLVNLPVGLLAFCFGCRTLPAEARHSSGKSDLAGLLLLSFGLPCFTYGVVKVTERSAGQHGSAFLYLAASVACMAAYIIHTRREKHPIVDLSPFRNRAYALAQTAIFFCGSSLYGGLVLLPLYFQLLRHQDAAHTGFLLLAYGAGSALSLRAGGKLTDQIGGGSTASIGLVIIILATLPFLFLSEHSSLIGVEVLQFLRGVGVSLAGLPIMSTAYSLVESEQLPDATVHANIVQRVGGSLGGALTVVLLEHWGDAKLAAFRMVFLVLTLFAAPALILTLWLAYEQSRKHRQSAGPANS